jgi:hypothetical protein
MITCPCSRFGFKPPCQGHAALLAAMPPKKRKATSASSSRPAAGGSLKAVPPSGPDQQLAGQDASHLLDLAAGTVRKRRQLGRRDSDEAVERSIERHFAGFSQIDLETQRLNGLTLRERVRADRSKLPPKGRLGSTYWRDLVQEWSSLNAGIGGLRPEVKDRWGFK